MNGRDDHSVRHSAVFVSDSIGLWTPEKCVSPENLLIIIWVYHFEFNQIPNDCENQMECQNRINILNNAFWSKMLCNDNVRRIVSYQVKLIDVQVQETFLLSQEFVNLKKTKKWDKKKFIPCQHS